MDIGQWLRGLGLQSYEQAFRDNGVDLDVLPRLTADDLKEIGVSAVGHRRKILDAVGELMAARPEAAGQKAPDRAERRQLTVMFCDLVGSTALSASLDPEDMQELLQVYHARVGDLVSKHGGFVAKYMGDGALIYFGYPQAHEDDAERAVRAGLALVAGVSELTARRRQPQCTRWHCHWACRCRRSSWGGRGAGARDSGRDAQPCSPAAGTGRGWCGGHRRQYAAACRRPVRALPTGAVSLKGFAEPVRAWRVIGEGKAESRFEALHGTRVTRLSAVRRNSTSFCRAGIRQRRGAGMLCSFQANPALASRGWCLPCANGCRESQRHRSATPALRITPTARSSPLSRSWSGRQDLRRMTIGRPASTSLNPCCLETVGQPNNAVALFADLLGIPTGSRLRACFDVIAAEEGASLPGISRTA